MTAVRAASNVGYDVIQALTRLPVTGRVYGTGISACAVGAFENAIMLGRVNQLAGVVGFNYIWTLDKRSSAATYLSKGAQGIMTNDPGPIVQEVRGHGYPLATPGARFANATSTNVQNQVPGCDCNYHPGGCRIQIPAPANWACRCVYKGAWTCGGLAVVCADPSSAACRAPSNSRESCLQGGGDCGGYKGSGMAKETSAVPE